MESTGWATHLETIIRCVVDKRADCSTVPTVFSPLSLARKLSGDRLGYDLKENPQAVTGALEAITETILAFMEACFREGCEGIFYSIQAASTAFHTEEEYLRFGEPYDRRILEAVRPRSRLTILHCHGERLMFDRLAALPADVWNWDDRRAGPTLAAGQARVPGAVCGGLDQWRRSRTGPPERAEAEAREAIAADERPRAHPRRRAASSFPIRRTRAGGAGEGAGRPAPAGPHPAPVAACSASSSCSSPSSPRASSSSRTCARAPDLPSEVSVLSDYRSLKGANKLPRLLSHAGVDFGGPPGSPVIAAAEGVVIHLTDWPPGCGLGVILSHPEFKRYTAYCHLQDILVRAARKWRAAGASAAWA